MIRSLGMLSVALLATFSGGSAAVSQDEGKKAKWTILVYMCADNDVATAALQDLEEMAYSGGADQVRVAIQVDLPDEIKRYYGDRDFYGIKLGATTKRIALERGDDRARFKEIEDIGEANMTDPGVLASFIAWGVKKYPAERTALVLWDHGAGWFGYGVDYSTIKREELERRYSRGETVKIEMMRMNQLESALSRGCKTSGLSRFDLVAFNCCLMAGIEVMRACHPYAKIVAGSEELLPATGFNYTSLLRTLAAKPDLSPEKLAEEMCKSLENDFIRERFGKYLTFSAIDLDKFAEVLTAADKLADACLEKLNAQGRTAWLQLAGAEYHTEEFGAINGVTLHSRDLYHLVRNLKGVVDDELRNGLLKAIEASVVARYKNEARPHSRGVSVYFPKTEAAHEKLLGLLGGDYGKATWSPKWNRLLLRYWEIGREDDDGPSMTGLTASKTELKVGEQLQIKTTIKADDIADAYFVLGTRTAKDETTILGTYPVDLKREALDCEFDGTWLAIGDDSKRIWVCPVLYQEVGEAGSRTFQVGIPASYLPPNAPFDRDVTLFFEVSFDKDWKFSQGKFTHAVEITSLGQQQIDLAEGGTLRPAYHVLRGKAKEPETRIGIEALSIGKKAPEIVELPLPEGRYVLGYRVTDLAGNTTFDSVEIRLKK